MTQTATRSPTRPSVAPAVLPAEVARRLAELRARAEAFRQRVAAEHSRVSPLLDELIEAATPRPGFRQHKHLAVIRLWGVLSHEFRLGLVHHHSNKTLEIAEARLVPSRMTFAAWGDGHEPAVAIESRTFGVLRGRRAVSNRRLIAEVGMHALHRRFQRGFDLTDAAIVADIAALAQAYEATVAEGGDFEVAARDGVWRGAVTLVAGTPTLAVRTYV